MNWKTLTDNLDYHHRNWYMHSAGRWYQITSAHVDLILSQLAPGEDHQRIRKQFTYRDKEAHARSKDTKKEQQLKLGDWIQE